jgi:5-methylcytosine-specific restriction endonuclease McrA
MNAALVHVSAFFDNEPQCEHANTHVVRYPIRGGGFQFRRQCDQCGDLVGGAISRSAAPTDVRPWDGEAQARREEARRERARENERRRAEFAANRRDWYHYYLTTSEWRAKADAVLARANYRCEGCGQRPATQVHHLTYDHVGTEFLFELVALCRPCHRRLHEVDDGDTGI